MGIATRNLTATKSAYVKASAPNTHYGTDGSTAYNISGSHSANDAKYLLFGLPSWPSSLKRNKLYCVRLRIYAKPNGGFPSAYSIGDFNASTVTYNSKPTIGSFVASLYTDGVRDWTDLFRPSDVDTGSEGRAANARNLLAGRGFAVTHDEASVDGLDWFVKAALSNGSAVYAEVTYDDAVTVKSKPQITTALSGGNPQTARTVAWKLVPASTSEHCADENWTQASARLYWRESGGSWKTISVSGSTTSLTVPGGTFPEGKTIEYYIQTTDTDGTTAQTTSASVTMDHSAVAPASYPSGAINPAAARTITWTLKGASQTTTTYTQASAKLFWKKSTESSYHQIAVSGSTQQVTVPANTFPSGATIQWYLQATDTLGYTSTCSVMSFTTLATTLTLTSFPASSGVDTRSAITFGWSLENTSGTVAQQSSVLYWRVQGAESYNAITNSSATKSVTVPANTFPTGTTIQWYVSATDATGTVITSAARTFTTASSRITPQTYPSGNSVDFGSALSFSWIFKPTSGSGSYGQRAASLFWRASTEDEWTEIQASGTTQRITVPAYTFPSNATISWYLTGTDIGGTASTSSTMSFKTAAPQITPQNSPTSGYADPRNAITFSWFFSTGSNNYPQASADFYWRVAGQTEWNHVQAEGSTQSVTIPANTFPRLQNIEWRLTGTDIGGTYSETQIYTFSTTASTAYAVCMDPVGKAADGAKPITLKWIVRNDDGSVATRTIVRWKLPTESQSEWHEIIDTTDSITEYTVAENTFPAGPIEWMVIAFNRDDVAGPESQASFVCVVAPDAPSGLTATAVPLTEIRWQSTGQEAYEVSIDGEVVKEGFGTDVYSYRVTEPLADGAHSIAVRIQGRYSLWSEAAETQIFVSNAPKGAIALSGEFGVDAELIWTYDGETEPETVAIYRDGKWIGTATGADRFLDRYVLGAHEYRVEYWFADGNYTRSETVSGTMSCRTMMIADIDGGPWLELGLSENEIRTMSFTRRRDSERSHITARKFPVLEISDYEELIGKFDCSFRWPEDAMEFERLFGRVVILKTRDGTVISGGLTETGRKVANLYIGYTFSIEQNDVEDFVRHDTDD